MAAEARGAAANLGPAATTAIDSSAASALTRAWLTCTTRPPDGVNPKRTLNAAQGRRTPVMRRQSQARVRGRFECARFGTFQDGGGDVSGHTFPEVNISGRPRRSDGRLDPWSVGVGQYSSSRTTC
jgi:hypothetical protein